MKLFYANSREGVVSVLNNLNAVLRERLNVEIGPITLIEPSSSTINSPPTVVPPEKGEVNYHELVMANQDKLGGEELQNAVLNITATGTFLSGF